MTYLEILSLHDSPILRKKAAVAIEDIANYIISYTLNSTDARLPGVDLNLLINAQGAQENPLQAADAFMWAIAMDSDIQNAGFNGGDSAATDTQVYNVVNSKYLTAWR